MKTVLILRQARLRPTSSGDLDRICHLLHDAEVRRYLCDDTILPRATVAGMLERSDRLDARGLGSWAIEAEGDQLIGMAALQPVSAAAAVAPTMVDGIEVFIALHPGAWGRGVAGDVLAELVRYARETCGLSRLVAAVDRPNGRSRRLMQRCGFRTMGAAPGPAHELVLYELDLVP